MKTLKKVGAVAALLAFVTACSILGDQTPETISFRMSGSAGQVVTLIYSQEFIAGVDEANITQVEVFSTDTVVQALPIDTIINIAVQQRFFVQVETADTVVVDVRIEVNDRGLVNISGGIFPDTPWRYVYEFNQTLTDIIEVIL